MVAQSLDIPQSQVQVIKPRIGGGFGSKQTGCCEIFVAFVTQQTGRPSYCCYTREETITAGNSRHQMQMTVKLGAMNDGTITAIDLHTLSNAGAYGEHATTTIGLSGHKSLPIYNHVKASRFSWDAVYTNTNRGGAYRGYGATQGQFAVESAVNELADMLHMDPADLRLKNIVREGEIMPQYYNEKLNACALDRCLLRAMDMIGWRDKPLAVDLGDRVRALGCALTMQGSGISNVDIAGIDMRLEEDGFITIGTGATDNGMGVDTILAQIAAEELGVESSLDRGARRGHRRVAVRRRLVRELGHVRDGPWRPRTPRPSCARRSAPRPPRCGTWTPPTWSLMVSTCACPTSVPRASRTATSRCATLPTCASRTSRAATRSPRMPLPACPFRLRRLWPALPRSRSTRPPAR